MPGHVLAAGKAAHVAPVRVLQRAEVDDLLVIRGLDVLAEGSVAGAEMLGEPDQLGLVERLAAKDHDRRPPPQVLELADCIRIIDDVGDSGMNLHRKGRMQGGNWQGGHDGVLPGRLADGLQTPRALQAHSP
ncbi:hypothetical protein D3C72_1870320 [compost metagenome]